MKVTIIQTNLVWENKTKNLSLLRDKISNLNEDTDLIVLPEMFSTGFSMNAKSLAEPMSGNTIQWLQKKIAEGSISANAANWANPIVTEIVPLEIFYPAEDYHQNYFRNNPYNSYCAYVVKAKVDKYKKVFS